MDALADELSKVPPHQNEAEQSVLGGILVDGKGLSPALEILRGDEFYRDNHRTIFQAFIELFQRNEPIDLVTVSEYLKEHDQLEAVGGVTYLASLMEIVPSAANVGTYSRLVSDKAVLRSLIQAAHQISSSCYSGGKSVAEVLDDAEATIFQISGRRVSATYSPIKDIVKESIKTIEMLQGNRDMVTGVPSHFVDLDRLTAGFQPSDLIIIAGRPGMGKTAFALNIARNAALESGVGVGIFSLEMSKEQLAMRLLCSEARVDSQKIRTGFMNSQEAAKLMTAAGFFMDAPIFIDDTPSIGVLEVRAKARRMKATHGIGMVVIDYLQLMRGRESAERRDLEISEISRSLKALAKELHIPVVALSQLNRKVEERHDKRPQLSDLRESGAIEQDADVICFIYREEQYNKDTSNKGISEILLKKQRNCPTGDISLAYFDKYTRFENLAREMN